MVKTIKNMNHDSLKLHELKNESDDHHQPTESESGEVIGYNEHILTEILSRLPVVSILRFKSVSKHWYSLLSHLYNKLKLISPVPAGLFYDDYYIPFDVNNQNNNNDNCPPFRTPIHTREFEIVQSCNGLLLCCSKMESEREYCVFNPTTKQFASIPSFKKSLNVVYKGNPLMVLAVHPSDCELYKLVCLYRNNTDQSQLHVLIFSSETKKWKTSETLTNVPNYSCDLTCGVYMNGGIYWSPEMIPNDSWYYFKLDVEKFQMLKIPSHMKVWWSNLYFGESNGRLHLVDVCWCKPSNLNVYEMMSDSSGWVVKYQVEVDRIIAEFHQVNWCGGLKILDIVRGEQEEDAFMVMQYHRVIKSYNFFHKSFKLLFVIPGYTHNHFERTIKGHRYVPTSCLI